MRALGPLAAAMAMFLCGCATSRALLEGSDAEQARFFFARIAAEPVFPVTASFSGIAHRAGRESTPFIAGVNAASPYSEKLGLYDPMGGAVAFIANDGGVISITRGPMADLAGLNEDMRIAVGRISLGRILSGAPGYEVSGGEAALGEDGGWVLTDGRQTLFSDPGRVYLARAEYRFMGVKATVEYPDRSGAPPAVISVSARGISVLLRRDQ